MSNLLRLVTLMLLVCMTTGGCKTNALYVGAVQASADFERVDSDLSGLTLGWEGSEGFKFDAYSEVQLLSDKDKQLDVNTVSIGALSQPKSLGPLEFRFAFDLGIGRAELEGLQNTNSLLSLGLGVQPRIILSPGFSLTGRLGYRQYFDTTDPTTCNDGTTSTSTGSGTCSHHGGINHYNDQIGDGGGLELTIGLRWLL